MFELVKHWYASKVNHYRRDAEASKFLADVMEGSRDDLSRWGEGGQWELLGSAYKGNFGDHQQTMVGMARRFVRTDPNGRAAVWGLLKYIMGRGIKITPKSKDPRIWYIWREFVTSERNRWFLRQFEIVKRLIRDGEVFIRRYRKGDGDLNTWKTTLRFVDPQDVKRTTEKTSNETDKMNAGVETDPNDVERVLNYHIQDRNDPLKTEVVPASEIKHYKFYADFDQMRGDSFLLPVMKHITFYEQWLKYRMILNKVRTAIVLIRKVEGSSDKLRTVADSIPAASRQPTGTTSKEGIKPGTILSANQGVDYKMESANINATDAKEDGRNILLQMAAGTGLPEYLFGDASNNNYASSLMAESPFVKEVQFWQALLEFYFSDLYRWVIQAAVDAKRITPPTDEDVFEKYGTDRDIKEQEPEKEEVQDGKKKPAGAKAGEKEGEAGSLHENPVEIFYGCDLQWPEIVHRDQKQTTDALAVQRSHGWVDDKSAAEMLGYDYEEIVRKQKMIEEDAEKNGNPLLKGGGESEIDPDVDAEAEDIAAGLTDEEREEILKDPKAAARIAAGKMKGGKVK